MKRDLIDLLLYCSLSVRVINSTQKKILSYHLEPIKNLGGKAKWKSMMRKISFQKSNNKSRFLSRWIGDESKWNGHVPSMIHSARSTVPPIAITILYWKLFCLARFGKGGNGRTDRHQVRKLWSLLSVTVGSEWIKSEQNKTEISSFHYAG